jgi:putative peptidoglycan lipid II flippase
LLTLIAALGAGAAVILFVFAPVWVTWLVPGFTPEVRSLTVALTRIQLPGLVLTAVISVLWAAHRARQRFVWPELSALIGVTATLAALIWGLPRYGIVLAAWAMLMRAGIQVVLLMPGAGRFCTPNFRTPMMTEAWGRIKPLLIGTAYYKMEPAVDRYLASMAGIGGVSLLYLAQQIYGTASQVLNAAVTVPMVPALAGHAQTADWTAFWRVYSHRLAVIAGVSACLYIAVFLLGKPTLHLIISDQRLTRVEVDQLWWLLVALAGLLIAGSIGQILSSAFYATGDTRTLTRIGFVVFTFGIGFKAIGFAEAGLVGLAIGTSLYYLLSACVQYAVLESRRRRTT